MTYLGVSSFNINTSVTITVTAKDSASANVGSGNDLFFVEITNACTKGTNFECVADAGRQTVLTSDIVQPMYDNLDGTYYYTYSVSRPGKITVSPLLYTQGAVYSEYYTNNALSGTMSSSSTSDYKQVYLASTTGAIFTGCTDNCSIKFYFRFMAPTTGTITFTLQADDISTLYIEGSQVVTASSTAMTGTYD